jgi:hypothetical protein
VGTPWARAATPALRLLGNFGYAEYKFNFIKILSKHLKLMIFCEYYVLPTHAGYFSIKGFYAQCRD